VLTLVRESASLQRKGNAGFSVSTQIMNERMLVKENCLIPETKKQSSSDIAEEGKTQTTSSSFPLRGVSSQPLCHITSGGQEGKKESQLQLGYISQLNSLVMESGDNKIPCDSLIHRAEEFYFHKDSNSRHKCTQVVTV